MQAFPKKVIERLKHYVYLYVDPRDGDIFYVGKGRANRCFAHLHAHAGSDKVERIDELRKLGLKPRIELLKWGLSEQEALLVEAAVIDLLGVDHLTNLVKGHGAGHGQRGTVEDVAAVLDAREAKITDPVILIRINKAFRYGMTTHELYDATRSAWKVAPEKHNPQPQYALAVYHGIVREVFSIATWVVGGSTMRVMDPDGRGRPEEQRRREFVGCVADDRVRKRYVGKSVAAHLEPGSQNPVTYVYC